MRKFLALCALSVACAAAAEQAKPHALIYTRNFVTNGKGFVHDNIASCVKSIQALGEQDGFTSEVSDDPKVFEGDLKRFKVIIFANSNNEAFATEAQKEAFQKYIRGGGGFVGIHSATGSERKWPWFWNLIGGSFDYHAVMQKFDIAVADPTHPSMAGQPAGGWTGWEDEFYVMKSQPAGLHVLMSGDPTKLRPDKRFAKTPNPCPLVWCHEFEGGRSWYTALGHKPAHYDDPLYRKHLLGGIRWAMGLDR